MRPELNILAIRKTLTEQTNAVAILITVSLSALIYGWIEGKLWPQARDEFQLEIANHFTWYHVAFFTLFMVIGFSLSVNRTFQVGRRVWYLIVASGASMLWGFWIEDMSYFSTTYPLEILQEGVWVEWGLGGFRVPIIGNYVPTTYVLLSLWGFVTFGIAFLLASRDRIRTKAREVGITLNPRSLKASVIRALAIVLPFAIVAEVSFLKAPVFTSFSFMGIEERIAFLGLTVLLPALAVLALVDLISRRFFKLV